MLAVSPLRNAKDGNNQGEMETNFSVGDFTDFVSDTSLLESIDFDDLFLGIHVDEDVLPDLEMDPEILAEFSVTSGGEESGTGTFCSSISVDEKATENHQGHYSSKDRDEDKVSEMDNNSSSSRGEEIVSKRDESVVVNPIPKEAEKAGKKSSSSSAQSSKNTNSAQAQGKRKVKVDWTPDLHRRFVQAVEQLGVDKAVPSRILELMGIDCLTRHNIASHLQKYRSHRKHLLAREQEAANWSHQRRHMYGSAGKRGSATATDMLTSAATTGSWLAPATMGFPPHHHPHQHATMAHHQHHPHFRPLHVWGHPSLDHSLMHMWPKHLPHTPAATHPPPPLQPAWAAPPSHAPSRSTEASYWHPANHQQRISNAPTPGTLCFTQPPLLPTRFAAPPVPGIPPHAMYKVDARGLSVSLGPLASHHPFDFHPSKETIDAAIGDALSKPWLPLPLGLKPPSMDSVLGELQRQGVPKIPPTSTTSCA